MGDPIQFFYRYNGGMNSKSDFLVHHDGSEKYLIRCGESTKIGEKVVVRLKTSTALNVEHAFLRTCPDGEERLTEMGIISELPNLNLWVAEIVLDMPVVNYRFLLFLDEGVYWYNGSGLVDHLPTDHEDFRILTGYTPVDWVRGSVFYQIFPDRFFDGNSENNVRDGEYSYRGEPARAARWGAVSQAQGRAKSVEFYGGDLQGIESKLDYLQDLGINALYLTPIFPSLSNHRYDVIDYFDIDCHLGGKDALASLRRKMDEAGMHLMLDIVPNHCGVAHPWFQDALSNHNADTAEYFTFTRHPDEYASWLGVKSLPKLNYKSNKLKEVMFRGSDSVFRYWLKEPFAIDGWRIDVANMLARQGADQLGMEIGRGIREAVKGENPHAYILGENFFDGTWQLQGEFLDANMNYSGFMRPVWSWLTAYRVWNRDKNEIVATKTPISTLSMVNTWRTFLASIPWDIALQQFNLLDSHDTERIKTIVGEDTLLHRLAAAMMFCFPGVPCIYYGDEIGLSSATGDNRACMNWNEADWDQDLRMFYQKLIRIRKEYPALIRGGFEVLTIEDDIIAFLRETATQQIVFIGNRGSDLDHFDLNVTQAGLPEGSVWLDILSGDQWTVRNGYIHFEPLQKGALILSRFG